MIFPYSKYTIEINVLIWFVVIIFPVIFVIRKLLNRSDINNLKWAVPYNTRKFRNMTGKYFLNHGWSEVKKASLRAVGADYYFQKDDVRILVTCLINQYEQRGFSFDIYSKIMMGKAATLRVLTMFSEPSICFYQQAVPKMPGLEEQGLFILPYTAIPEVMSIALTGDLKNTQEGTWQRLLLRKIPARCWEISDFYKKEGDLDKAIEWARLIPNAGVRGARGQVKLASLYFDASNYVEADKAAHRSMELAPYMPGPYRLLSLIKDSLGERDQAIHFANMWINIAGKDFRPRKFLFDLLSKYGEHDRAFTVINEAVSFFPEEPLLKKIHEKSLKQRSALER